MRLWPTLPAVVKAVHVVKKVSQNSLGSPIAKGKLVVRNISKCQKIKLIYVLDRINRSIRSSNVVASTGLSSLAAWEIDIGDSFDIEHSGVYGGTEEPEVLIRDGSVRASPGTQEPPQFPLSAVVVSSS